MESSAVRQLQGNLPRNQGLNSTFESEKPSDFKEERFLIKKQLYRGIRDNDPEKIVSRTGGRDTEQNFEYDEYSEVHNILTEKRKNFDQHKAATNNLRKQIQTLKKEIDDLLFVEGSFKGSINQSLVNLDEVTNQLNDTKEECQYTVFRKEVYNHMLERTKTTYLVEKKRMFDMELELDRARNHHRSIMLEATNKKRLEKQCRKMLASIEKVVSIEKKNREVRLSSMQDVIGKKEEAVRKKSERDREIAYLVDAASNQKTMQEKEWNKVLLANKLLHCILKTKISRQLSLHSQVQKTFQRIKLNTGVGQADILVEKYLQRQHTYGQLLNSISEKEPMVEKRQMANQQLKIELKQLSQQERADRGSQRKLTEDDETSRKQKELQQLSKKAITYERQREAFYQWAIKFLKKHDLLADQNGLNKLNYFEAYPRSQLEVLYRKVESIVTTTLKQAAKNPQEVEQKLLENKLESTLGSETLARNMRVRTEARIANATNDDDGHEDANEFEYLQEHRRSIKRDQRNKKFRIKTKAH